MEQQNAPMDQGTARSSPSNIMHTHRDAPAEDMVHAVLPPSAVGYQTPTDQGIPRASPASIKHTYNGPPVDDIPNLMLPPPGGAGGA